MLPAEYLVYRGILSANAGGTGIFLALSLAPTSYSYFSFSPFFQGTITERKFKEWKFHLFKTDEEALELMKKSKVEHYWNLAQSQTVLEEENTN